MNRRQLLKGALLAAPSFGGSVTPLMHGWLTPLQPGGGATLAARDELAELGAREAVRRIRSGEMTAESYAVHLLSRCHELRHLNTVISLNEVHVQEQARAVDRDRARGKRLGALAGLPFMVKDQIEVAGYPTTAGTAALRGYISKQSAPVVESVLRAGAVLFAKANLQELAQGPTSSNPTFGFVRNPYDPARIPGGSSGGNAAALAARIVPAGLGEDTGGSIRIPAAMCGIAGLRPSTGAGRKRYFDGGLVPPARSDDLQTIGPMARTVADVALLDEVITGQRVRPIRDLKDVRIGIPRASYWEREDVDIGVARCTLDAFARLRESGATLIEIDFDRLIELGDEVAPAFASSGRDADFVEWLARNLPGVTIEQVVAEIASKDVKASREARLKATPTQGLSPDARARLRAMTARQYEAMFHSSRISSVAFPCIAVPPPLINPEGDAPGAQIEVNGKQFNRNAVLIRNTWWGARMGAPGLVLPAGLSDGLPVSLEFEGLPGDDSRLLALGIAVENVLGPLPAPPEPAEVLRI